MANLRVLFCGSFLLLSLIAAVPYCSAEEVNDLPPPIDSTTPQDLPAPSLGNPEEANTPPPQEKALAPSANVNEELSLPEDSARKVGDNDNLYLPPPNEAAPVAPSQHEPTYTVSGGTVRRDEEVLTGMEHKPGFSMMLGSGYRNYIPRINYQPNTSDPADSGFAGWRAGLAWEAGVRALNIKDVISIWPRVGMITGMDKMYRLSLIGELQLSNYFQLLGGYTLRQNYVWWPGPNHDSVNKKFNENVLGLGGEIEFAVGPHYSVGVRGYVEREMYMIGIVLNLEPGPRQKVENLNYPSTIW